MASLNAKKDFVCLSKRNNISILKYCQTEFVKSMIQNYPYSLPLTPLVWSPTTFKPESLQLNIHSFKY